MRYNAKITLRTGAVVKFYDVAIDDKFAWRQQEWLSVSMTDKTNTAIRTADISMLKLTQAKNGAAARGSKYAAKRQIKRQAGLKRIGAA